MRGYDLQEGEYDKRSLSKDELWGMMNWLFSSYSKNDSSYKFLLFKSILDCMNDINVEMNIHFDMLFMRFTEIAWNLVLWYGIRQKAVGEGKRETYLEQVLHEYFTMNLENQFIKFEDVPTYDRKRICKKVKVKCKKYVVGALYGDMNGLFYSFDKKKEWIKLNPVVYEFVQQNRAIIENLNYFKWSKFYENINDEELTEKLIGLIDSNFKRNNESVYRAILAYEFERSDINKDKVQEANTLELLYMAEEAQEHYDIESKFSCDIIEEELFCDYEMMKSYLADPILLIDKLKKEKIKKSSK